MTVVRRMTKDDLIGRCSELEKCYIDILNSQPFVSVENDDFADENETQMFDCFNRIKQVVQKEKDAIDMYQRAIKNPMHKATINTVALLINESPKKLLTNIRGEIKKSSISDKAKYKLASFFSNKLAAFITEDNNRCKIGFWKPSSKFSAFIKIAQLESNLKSQRN
jgi:hypothetical protein